MAKHTLGPWVLSATDDTVVIDATGLEVAAIDGDYNDPDTWPQMEANARLIAAAPEMLDALRTAKAFIEREYRDPSVEPSGEWLSKEARKPHAVICEAIAKAEGGMK